MTNQMWTIDNFAALDRVTVGEARTIYRTEQRHTAGDASPPGRTPFRLTGLSITVPCHGWSEAGDAGSAASGPGAAGASGAGSVFVAYGDTDVFTLGQSMRPEAMVFEQAGGAWKLAAVVNGSPGGGGPRWPALCARRNGPARRRGAGTRGLPGGAGPGAGSRRDRHGRDGPDGGAFRGELLLRGPGLDQRPVRPREQQGPGGRRHAGPAVYPGPRPGARPAPGGRAADTGWSGSSPRSRATRSATGVRKASLAGRQPCCVTPALRWCTTRPTPSSLPTRRPTRRVRPAVGSCWTASSAGR